MSDLEQAIERGFAGGPARPHEQYEQQGKLSVRERVARLLDEGSLSENGLPANREHEGLGADGVVTGTGTIAGRPVAVMANDPTVRDGAWGPKTAEKIIRIQEQALVGRVPMVYLVDSAGARITEQVHGFAARRGAGRILHMQTKLSGVVPQACVLFGATAAERAFIPAFCDVVIMRDGNASMSLGSPRLAETVSGEKVTLEEMGGAKMHTGVSGCGHQLVGSDEDGIDAAKRYLSYLPSHWEWAAPVARPSGPASQRAIGEIVPEDENQPFEMHELLASLLDADSFFELHACWAKELIVGFGRLNGRAIGVVANQPAVSGGMLFVDSADKAARFIHTCNAFNLPLLFLADAPGFTIGTAAERRGIIRHGAKMIGAISEATVPKISVIVRKAYGAGLYAMAGHGFEPDACLALPTASIAAMGSEAAIEADVDIWHLASELVVDAVVQSEDLRAELIRRFAVSAGKRREWPAKRNAITPV
jgi:acetyl-CoA carboxylase carboxyltransferase component